MNQYLPHFITLVMKEPKQFIRNFIKIQFSDTLEKSIQSQNIYMNYLETEENFRLDYFIFIHDTILNIQFSNTHNWKNTTTKLIKNQKSKKIILYHYEIHSLKDVEKLKKETNFVS